MTLTVEASDLRKTVRAALQATPIWDLHTHLYPPAFGATLGGAGGKDDPTGMMLWGIDELLTYHYLVAELFRAAPHDALTFEQFWALTKSQQADLVWEHLFQRASPVSEACRGVLTTLTRLGLDPNEPTLAGYRRWFAEQDADAHLDRVMQLAGVDRITMTNDPFDDNERQRWLEDPNLAPTIAADARFCGVLRVDPMIVDWPIAARRLQEWGYEVDAQNFSENTIANGRRFLGDWINRLGARYCAVSLPPEFRYPCDASNPQAVAGEQALRQIILPACAEAGIPLAMMIGVTRAVHPAMRMAGDTLGLADPRSVAHLCRDFPDQRFLCTMLARENQHELAVTARKFRNLMLFGCWWFVNNPSLIEETTRMRMELLGTSFVPQHSDARVLEQLVYKWDHSREIIARVLEDKYADLAATGWRVTAEAIRRDAHALLRGHTAAWLGGE